MIFICQRILFFSFDVLCGLGKPNVMVSSPVRPGSFPIRYRQGPFQYPVTEFSFHDSILDERTLVLYRLVVIPEVHNCELLSIQSPVPLISPAIKVIVAVKNILIIGPQLPGVRSSVEKQ